MSLPNVINTSYVTNLHAEDTAEKKNALGQRMEYDDGRKFRYMLAGGTTLVMNQLQQGKIIVTGDDNLGVDAAAVVGATTVIFTSATTTAANYYNGGWMGVTVAPGIGYIYKVKSSPLFSSGAGDIITLEVDTPIVVALTASSEISLIPNVWNGVVVAPITTLTSPLVGVTAAPVTNAQYGWVQSGGICVVEGAGSELAGNNSAAVLAAEGRDGVNVTDIDEVFGIVLTVTGSGGNGHLVDLRID